MDDPDRVEISVTGTEIQFSPVEDEEDGLRVTESTGDISAAGIVSEHGLSIEEGRYDAVSLEERTWVIDVGDGIRDPVGGRDTRVDEFRAALEQDNIEEAFTVDEVRAVRTEIGDEELLEGLIEADDRKSAVEAYESQLAALRD